MLREPARYFGNALEYPCKDGRAYLRTPSLHVFAKELKKEKNALSQCVCVVK